MVVNSTGFIRDAGGWLGGAPWAGSQPCVFPRVAKGLFFNSEHGTFPLRPQRSLLDLSEEQSSCVKDSSYVQSGLKTTLYLLSSW